MNEEVAEEINNVLDDDLTQQYEEGYDDGLIPNEMRRNFGDTGDRFYECEHCGAFRMKKIERFKYAKGDDNKDLSIKPKGKSLERKWEFIYTKIFSVMDSYMLRCQE